MTAHYTEDMLADFAQVSFFRLDGLGDTQHEWNLGTLGIWKSSSLECRPRPVPTYCRGSLVFDLRDDMKFVTLPFRCKDGTPAIAIVLRSSDEDLFGGWTPADRTDEAERIAAFLNRELAAARAYHRERATIAAS